MKSIYLPSILLLVSMSLSAQLRLNVQGDAHIQSRLKLVTTGATVFVGSDNGLNNTGTSNGFLGVSAGTDNLAGGKNTFPGALAGYDNAGGNENVFIGHESGTYNNDGSGNTFVGLEAGTNNYNGDPSGLVPL